MNNATEARLRRLRAAQVLDDAGAAAQAFRQAQEVAATPDPCGALIASQAREPAPRVGMLSGSFNPLTRAHVALADSAQSAGRLDLTVWLIPVVAINKAGVERAALVDRILQMRAFVQTRGDALAVVNRGLYVEQANIVQKLIPGCEELLIVLGFDKIVQILDPVYYADRSAALDLLFSQVEALVAPRDGEDEAALAELLARPANQRYRARITFCPLPRRYQGDSSTEARAAASLGPAGARTVYTLLAPEGRALAALPDVYAPTSAAAPGDRYTQRQTLIAQVAAHPPASATADRYKFEHLSELLNQVES
jgi:nicotinic acid mononucleotide adenylyltransferase